MIVFRISNPPRQPWQYVVIYAQILETCWWWNARHENENTKLYRWNWPDAGAFEPCKYLVPVRYNLEKPYGEASLGENIPAHLIRSASELCPFLGVRVEMLFKELGLYGPVHPSSPEA